MPPNRIKELRLRNNLTQDEMAEALHISQNAYSLIETGKTRLIDKERINIIAERFGVNPLELGLFDGMGVTENFNEKVEHGYVHYIETLNSDNKELTQALLEQLNTKGKQIDQLFTSNAQLMQLLADKKN